jgi:hypothetical protein
VNILVTVSRTFRYVFGRRAKGPTHSVSVVVPCPPIRRPLMLFIKVRITIFKEFNILLCDQRLKILRW